MLRKCLTILLIGLFPVLLWAGKYNRELEIGDPAPSWSSLPGVDGKEYSLADFAAKEVLVVAFTCNSCPYAVDYEDRMIEFAKQHCGAKAKVALVAINVNKIEADSLPQMKKRAETKQFPFPYLFDDTQMTAIKYGATRTPEFFVLDKYRKIAYMGAFDDSPDAKKAKQNYLKAAVQATLAGKQVEVAETNPIGCNIRFERRRRRRGSTD